MGDGAANMTANWKETKKAREQGSEGGEGGEQNQFLLM